MRMGATLEVDVRATADEIHSLSLLLLLLLLPSPGQTETIARGSPTA